MDTGTFVEYIIVGAGAAGLQLGYFLQRQQRHYLILEAGEMPGGFWDTFPRHRRMVSINKRHTGYRDLEPRLRYDWNSLLCEDQELAFVHYSTQYFPDASDYKRYLVDFATHFALHIQYSCRICQISNGAEFFSLVDQSGHHYSCRYLIIATGVGLPYVPDIPGIELAERYVDCPVDPLGYRDQRVLIVGKGNAAFELANDLTSTARVIHLCSPTPVQLAWETHYMGHLRAVNNDFLDTYHLKGQNSVLNARIERIERHGDEFIAHIAYSLAKGQRMALAYDRVIVCTGFRFDTSLFADSCRPALALHDRLPAMTSAWESPNIQRLYFAGVLMQVRDYHKTMSNVLHGFRFNIEALSHILAERYHGELLPHQIIPATPQAIAEQLIERASMSAAIFLQPGFLCDVVVVRRDEQAAECYRGLPVAYVHDGALGQSDHYYTLTLEYGHFDGNPLAVERDPDPRQAHKDLYVHPIVRRFDGPTLIDEFHIPENLENDWRLDRPPEEQTSIRAITLLGQAPNAQRFTYGQRLQDFLGAQLAWSDSATSVHAPDTAERT